MIEPNYLVPIRAIRQKKQHKDNTLLLMQVGEKHAKLLQVLRETDLRLARHYFCCLFDNVDVANRGCGLLDYTENDIQIGEPNEASLYPVSLEVRISGRTINWLREQTRARVPPLAGFITLECRD